MQTKCSPHIAGLAVLLALAAAPLTWAASATVSGVVRDSSGTPQIGAEVELLRSDLSIAASVHTGSDGRYVIASVLPGQYALKAMNTAFLPSLRENLRLHSGATVVNLTLNTLYEMMQWLPAEPRSSNAPQDDWAWTLRSAADRPLLRWLEDGPLVVVSDGSGATPKLKARIMASGQAGTFGESGERFSAEVEDTPSDSRELLARVDFSPNSDAGIESMLGFRQDLGMVGSVESVAAIEVHPEIESSAGEGLEEAALTSKETMRLGPAIDAEVGATEVLANTGGSQPIAKSLPFANVEWRHGQSAFRYRMATMADGLRSGNSEAAVPRFSSRDGALALEHGLHQEIRWQRRTNESGLAVAFYADHLVNPVLEASGRFQNDQPSTAGALIDPASSMMRAAGDGFSSAGIEASAEQHLPGANLVRVSYANGNALAAPAQPHPTELAQLVAAFHPRRVQSYAISLSGTLDGTGTKWQASYRWQSDDTVTEVAPYSADLVAPYLNLRMKQLLHQSRDGVGNIEAMLEVTNLLAQGYQPYVFTDGSVVFFAQDQRSVRGGLAFTF